MDPSGGYQISNGSVVPPRGYALSGKIMLCALVALFAVVLLVVFLHLYLRYRLLRLASQRRRRRRLRSRRLTFAAVDPAAAVAGGLDPAALKFLPIIVISGEESECAVCLCEFEEGEKVRGLPRCGHRFHIECIDMWFHSHATCPLCRSPVEPTSPPPPPPPPPPPMPGGAGTSSGGGDLRVEVLGLGFGSPSWVKSPGGRMSAIRRILSWDRRRVGEEPDLERGEAADLDPPPTLPPPPPSALPAAELR